MKRILTTIKIFVIMTLSTVIITQHNTMTTQANQVIIKRSNYFKPHLYKNQQSTKYKASNNMKSSELTIIEDIKKGCKLLSSQKVDSMKILNGFGVLRTEGNFYDDEVKPFNNNFERVFILDRTLYFDIEDSESVSIEGLKAEFGDYVVLGYKLPRTIEFEYKLSSPNSSATQSFEITARYHESRVSSISISQKLN
jgi:hypothetical protein